MPWRTPHRSNLRDEARQGDNTVAGADQFASAAPVWLVWLVWLAPDRWPKWYPNRPDGYDNDNRTIGILHDECLHLRVTHVSGGFRARDAREPTGPQGAPGRLVTARDPGQVLSGRCTGDRRQHGVLWRTRGAIAAPQRQCVCQRCGRRRRGRDRSTQCRLGRVSRERGRRGRGSWTPLHPIYALDGTPLPPPARSGHPPVGPLERGALWSG